MKVIEKTIQPLGGEMMGKSKGGWPSKNPGKPSGGGRDNNPPK
jgi:hypothetical protein